MRHLDRSGDCNPGNFGAITKMAMQRITLFLLLGWCSMACSANSLSCAGTKSGPPIPAFTVTDEATDLVFVWVDEKGNSHTELSAKEVPAAECERVKTMKPGTDDGAHGDYVFVANLCSKLPSGAYDVRAITRATFEQELLQRRQKQGPTLASAEHEAGTGEPTLTKQTHVDVVIYGASWCSACHTAADFLRKKGIQFVEKDIEREPAAAMEMQEKLRQNGLAGGSIPVIDVRGTVMQGFDPQRVEAALLAPGHGRNRPQNEAL